MHSYSSSEIHPSVLAQVRVIDLALSSEEIRELMLTQLLQSECRELLTQHLQLLSDEQLLQKKLATEEVKWIGSIITNKQDSVLQHINSLCRQFCCHSNTVL